MTDQDINERLHLFVTGAKEITARMPADNVGTVMVATELTGWKPLPDFLHDGNAMLKLLDAMHAADHVPHISRHWEWGWSCDFEAGSPRDQDYHPTLPAAAALAAINVIEGGKA